jgi:hypothetical protein
MADEIRDDQIEGVTTDATEVETPTGDAEKGAVMGGVGGLITGAIAGSAVGPVGAVVGAVVGGVIGAAASGAAVAAVDRIDDDSNFSGLPDDMSFQDAPDEREPMVIDRNAPPPIRSAPHLDDTATGRETPIGVGMQEAVAMTDPSNTVITPIASVTEVEMVVPAEPLMGEGVSGDAETPGTYRPPVNTPTDGGWDRDNDANQIDVNPAGTESIVETTGPGNASGSYGYADKPIDGRQNKDS